jgi:uncharacterized membrane protein
MPQRSPAEIRDSIEANRNELALSIVQLRGEVAHLADWRGHLQRHRREVIVAGALVGLALGTRLLRRRRR